MSMSYALPFNGLLKDIGLTDYASANLLLCLIVLFICLCTGTLSSSTSKMEIYAICFFLFTYLCV